MFSPFHFLSINYSYVLILIFFYFFSMNSHMKFLFKLMIKIKFFMKMLMFMLIMLNIMSLIPYSWALTAYIWNNLLISMLMCYSLNFYMVFKHMNLIFSSFLPLGSPVFLWLLLIFLENISMIIRPLTLSLRLTCNLMAGHVLISLMSNLSMVYMILLMILFFFEMMISLIQAQVFSMLNFIYLKETI